MRLRRSTAGHGYAVRGKDRSQRPDELDHVHSRRRSGVAAGADPPPNRGPAVLDQRPTPAERTGQRVRRAAAVSRCGARVASDRSVDGGGLAERTVPGRRLAVPVSSRSGRADVECSGNGHDRRPVGDLALRLCARRTFPAQLADVLHGWGIHAPRNQERDPPGAALWLDLDGELDCRLGDPGDDPVQQSVRAGGQAEASLAVLRTRWRWLFFSRVSSCR